MKRIAAILAALLIISGVFSGCKINFSDIIKITPVTTAAENTEAGEPWNSTTVESGQTTAAEAETTTRKTTQTTAKPKQTTTAPAQTTAKPGIRRDGVYTTKADVSAYIHQYNKLPKNFITKEQARALGWPGGDLEPYAPGKCIGGSHFGNYPDENGVKPFPEASGRKFFECDIDTLGAHDRGPKRLVYSNDGLIYYTPDHYESFIRLY